MLNIPQELTAWKVSETATKSKLEADNAKQCYLEIACKIRQNGVYLLLGSATEQFMFRSEIHGNRASVISTR